MGCQPWASWPSVSPAPEPSSQLCSGAAPRPSIALYSSFCCPYCCLVPKLNPSLCNPTDSCQQEALSATPGSSVLGICQARILEWVAISLQGNLLDQGIELKSAALAGRFFPTEPRTCHLNCCSRRASLLPNLPPPICLRQTTFVHGRALATTAGFFFFFFWMHLFIYSFWCLKLQIKWSVQLCQFKKISHFPILFQKKLHHILTQ